jgi:uracil phosphoribosyltransferase
MHIKRAQSFLLYMISRPQHYRLCPMLAHPDFPNLFECTHPLIQHKLTHMRDKETSTKTFRQLLREIALLMGYEVTRNLETEMVDVETPVTRTQAPVISGKKLVVAPILRAGTGMADGLLELLPSARVGHIGLYRDKDTHLPHEYLIKLPSPEGRMFILVDPMLATGHSAVYAAQILLDRGVQPQHIRFMALVAAPEGIRVFHAAHPDIAVYVAALDEKLNEKAYIVPGLGDAGDRLFGTY